MALNFSDWRPDVSDLNATFTRFVRNVLPQADGYGPFPGPRVYTSALPAVCRGYFFARNSDGSVEIFAGTETKLYKLDVTTLGWTDVSASGGSYAPLSTDANWTFAQFNSVVIAAQANEKPQAFTLASSSDFADLGGNPPQAAFVTVVNRFLVLSGILATPRRVQWSGLNALTTWTSGVTYSDFQDLPDGGNTKGVVGGEFGLILQDTAIRRMTFAPGADIIFQIDRIAKDVGTAYPYSVIDANGSVLFHSTKGFVQMTGDGAMVPIGLERVDRTFAAACDPNAPQLVIGVSRPGSNVVMWTYKEEDHSTKTFNKVLAYDMVLKRWAPIDLEGEYLASLAKPGVPLEGLGTIGSVAISDANDNGSGEIRLEVASTAGWSTGMIKYVAAVEGTTEAIGLWTITVVDGTHIDLQGSAFSNAYTQGGYVEGSIDDMDMSLDDFSAATLNQLSIIGPDHKLGYFNGDNLEAVLESAEQSDVKTRLFVSGFHPLTDAPSVYASTGGRENLNATPTFSAETAINAQGFCPQRRSTRHARARIRIPEGTAWTFATGVDPIAQQDGER